MPSQSTPVLEIKTTNDAVYMGQGAGFQIKQPATDISIFKGILQNSSEGSGISVPVLPIGQPETIAQNCILQTYTNTSTTKYKCGLYIDVSGTQGTAANSDRLHGIFIQSGGMFIGGDYTELRSNNVLCGVTCAGKVSATGSLLRSWVISHMGGYLTSSRTGEGRYRISFSKTSYLLRSLRLQRPYYAGRPAFERQSWSVCLYDGTYILLFRCMDCGRCFDQRLWIYFHRGYHEQIFCELI